MKRALALILAMLLIGSAALAEIDLSGLSYDELVALKDQINLAMWNCEEWQEVTVPVGVWKVGEDIPAGHWTIKPAQEDDYLFVWYMNDIDPVTGGPAQGSRNVNYELASPGHLVFGHEKPAECDIEMEEGWYFTNRGLVVITPYTGKPSLGFK